MAAMFADRLLVVHDDDSVTEYAQVRYWLDRKGVSVFDADGGFVARHEDVLHTSVG